MTEYEVYVTQTDAQGLFPAVQVIKQGANPMICSWRGSGWTQRIASPLKQHPDAMGPTVRGAV